MHGKLLGGILVMCNKRQGIYTNNINTIDYKYTVTSTTLEINMVTRSRCALVFIKVLAIVFLFIALVGCVQLSDKEPQSVLLASPAEKSTQFILLDAGNYEGDLTFALAEHGFKIKPIAVTKEVTELESNSRIVSYKNAGFRYALKLSVSHDRAWICAFSGAHRVNATLSVVDIGTNETLAVLRQVGPDGSCPPLTPVWPLLAEELARVWK